MKKQQLHEALAVLLTKLSSARDNPLLMDNYVTTMESDNPWIGMLMKSIGGDASVKESMTDEAIEGMVNSMLGE